MAIMSTHNPWIFTFGLLGNLISFVVFLSPVPTFLRIWRKKSTEGFQSFPYVVALFSSMIWLYYASSRSDAFLLITINSVGCLIETIYIALYIAFAPKQARIFTLRILILLNFGGFCLILLLSHFFAKGSSRVRILGWVCVVFSVIVFAAPLGIMRLVIRTKSVEFMPFYLSLFLTLSAVMWLLYGVLLKDFYVAIPNIVGLVLGLIQMVLYVIFKNFRSVPVEPKKPPQLSDDIINVDVEKAMNATITGEMQQHSKPNHDINKVSDENNFTHGDENGHEGQHEKNMDVFNQDQPNKCEA